MSDALAMAPAGLVRAGIVDLILLGVVVEAGVLLGLRLVTGRGVRPVVLLANLGAGASLLLALRLVLAGDGFSVGAAACLAVALLAHLIDLALRWERRAPREASGHDPA